MRLCPFSALLIGSLACGSSGSEPPDPLAEEYCADCSDRGSCIAVVDTALKTACPPETRTYYQCVTDNGCEPTACQAEWVAREACLRPAP